jgi:hypothetical protein
MKSRPVRVASAAVAKLGRHPVTITAMPAAIWLERPSSERACAAGTEVIGARRRAY